MSSLPQGALRALIGEDLAESEFIERFWGKLPYVAKAASRPDKRLYSAERFWERAFVSEIDAAKRTESDEQEQFRIQSEQVEALFGAGFTICGNVSHDPSLAPLLVGIKSRLSLLGGPSFAKVYASPQGGGFALHTDPHHVFVIQLTGKKRWRYQPSPVEAPVDGTRISGEFVVYTGRREGEPMLDDGGKPVPVPASGFSEVILEPDDMLYLPPGYWHRADAIGTSVALSVSPPRASAAQVLSDLVREALLQTPEGRRDVIACGEDTAAVGKHLRSCLDGWLERPQAIEPSQLLRVWSSGVAREREGPALSADATPDVRKTDRLFRVDHNPLLVSADEAQGSVQFFQGGAEWTFPLDALPFVECLAQHQTFTAREAMRWDRRLDWDGAKAVLDQLVGVGILRVDRPANHKVERQAGPDSPTTASGVDPRPPAQSEKHRTPDGGHQDE